MMMSNLPFYFPLLIASSLINMPLRASDGPVHFNMTLPPDTALDPAVYQPIIQTYDLGNRTQSNPDEEVPRRIDQPTRIIEFNVDGTTEVHEAFTSIHPLNLRTERLGELLASIPTEIRAALLLTHNNLTTHDISDISQHLPNLYTEITAQDFFAPRTQMRISPELHQALALYPLNNTTQFSLITPLLYAQNIAKLCTSTCSNWYHAAYTKISTPLCGLYYWLRPLNVKPAIAVIDRCHTNIANSIRPDLDEKRQKLIAQKLAETRTRLLSTITKAQNENNVRLLKKTYFN